MRLILIFALLAVVYSSCIKPESEYDEMPPLGGVSRDSLLKADYKYLKTLVDDGAASSDEYYKFAECALELKELPAALKAIEKGLSLRPDQPDFHFLESRIHLASGNRKKAIEAAENAAGQRFQNPEFYAYMAELYLEADSLRLAEEYIRESLILAPGWVPSLQSRSELLLRKGRVAESQEVLYRANRIDPENIRTHDLLAKSYLETPGRLDSAYRINKRGLALAMADHEGLLFNQAKIMERLGFPDSAVYLYRQIVKIPHKMHVYAEMAEIYIKQGGYSRGYALLAKQIEETPLIKLFYFRAGYCLEHLGKYEAAHALYVKGLGRFPDDRQLQYAVNKMSAKMEYKYRSIE